MYVCWIKTSDLAWYYSPQCSNTWAETRKTVIFSLLTFNFLSRLSLCSGENQSERPLVMKGGAKTLFWNGEVCAKWSVESCTQGPLLGRAASLLSSLQGGEGFLGPDPGCVVLYVTAPDIGTMCVLQGLFSGDPEEPGNTHRPHLPFPCAGGETVSRNFAGSKGTRWDYGWPHMVLLKSE